jgi:putative membrane protein
LNLQVAATMPPLSDDDLEERRHEFERTLMDADRMMMQTVQTALSLIGFGFTINTFFAEVTDPARAPNAGQAARALGVALLMIGLLLLITGTWTQARFRRELKRRYAGPELRSRGGLYSRFTPSFVSAVLLMFVGLVVLGWVLLRWLL